jgi:arylsulfatase A-like enzyme
MIRLCTLVASALVFLNPLWAAAAERPPNIVLIMADDVGCETLGCYGGQSYKTPHIDRLAKTGLKFTHCYAMPVCHPTRTCLLSGRYPRHQGNPRWGTFPRVDEAQTLAKALQSAGYRTSISGKWQLTLLLKDPQQPHRMGFDDYCLFGWHEGPRYHQPMIHQNGALRTDVSDRYGPSVYVDHIVDFMKRNKDRPFFAFYSMALCHDVTDDLKQPVPYARNKDHYDTFAEMMAQMDIHVGRVTAAIRRLGLEKDTLVLFTTDNGTAKRSLHQAVDGKFIRRPVSSRIGGKLVPGGKGNLSDDGTHVPLLASWPGRISPGTTTDHLVDMSDFLPTFRELTGKTLSSRDRVKIDGQSFAGVLVGRGGRGRRWAYAERGTRRFFVRTQNWKLYNNGKLYHVPRDINEKSPVALSRAPKSAAADIRLLQQAIATIDDGHAFPNRTKN